MRVIVVDDDQLVEMSLTTILGSDEEIEVVGSGHDGSEAVALYQKEKPDVVLMDIQMQEMSGLAAAEEILTMDKAAKILLLTTFSDEEYIVRALGLGVKGYILKQDFEADYDIGEKEQEIIEQAAMGKSNREIAQSLFLSEGTVRNYISAILEKLSLRDRTQLVVFYFTKIC